MRITRRQFEKRIGQAILSSGLFTWSGCKPRPSEKTAPSGAQETPLLRMTRGGVDLAVPGDQPAGETWRYGLAFPFQVAAKRAALFANIRGKRGHDFEVGTDVVLFDDLDHVSTGERVRVSRNETATNPKSNPPGKPAILVKFPIRGGFVPLGAKRPDGSAHPHAGTGFGAAQVEGWTADRDAPFKGPETYEFMEIYQFAYDGRSFQVTRSDRIEFDRLLAGTLLNNPGLSAALADGDDLLFPMGGQIADGQGSGVTRWRRGADGWRPVAWHPVTSSDHSFEPTLIRDVDGSLLFCARGGAEPDYFDIRIWRSSDGAQTWTKIIHSRGAISSVPICLNQAADGTPYVASNLYEVFLGKVPAQYRSPRDSQGRLRAGGWMRDKVCLWPLNGSRNQLEAPILARHCTAEFGPAPGGVTWNADHPAATTVQLADGRWHNVIAMRVCDRAEVWAGITPPAPTGTYVEEVSSTGAPRPLWSF